jgi:hypothetical protein
MAGDTAIAAIVRASAVKGAVIRIGLLLWFMVAICDNDATLSRAR